MSTPPKTKIVLKKQTKEVQEQVKNKSPKVKVIVKFEKLPEISCTQKKPEEKVELTGEIGAVESESHVSRKKYTSQSDGISDRITLMVEGGRHLNDDSKYSEEKLSSAMSDIIDYTKDLFGKIGATIEHVSTISLYECQEYFHKVGGPPPNPENKKVCMKPDGGIIIMKKGNVCIPILIIEDKVQGTNDTRHQQGLSKQATGNAIERGAKNIRGAEMIFSSMEIFPYVMFASGCDFHESETISKRIEMMNMGFPNKYIPISPETTDEMISSKVNEIISSIDIKKKCGKCIASVFVKAHKWDEMRHRSSLWGKAERIKICKKIIDMVFEYITTSAILDT